MTEVAYEWNNIDVTAFLSLRDDIRQTLDDVAGSEEIVRSLEKDFLLPKEIIEIKRSLGLECGQSILFYGLPGVGKTFLAYALANSYKKFYGDVAIVDINCGALRENYVGKTEANIEAAFAFTEQFQRCVVILDGFDAIGYGRFKDGTDPVTHRIITLIREIQTFAHSDSHLLLATVGNPADLDENLPYRFSHQIMISPLSLLGIHERLKREIGSICDSDVNLMDLALALQEKGFTNYDLSLFVNTLKTALFEEMMRGVKIDKLNPLIVERILREAKSNVRKMDIDALEAYNNQRNY